MCDLIDGDFAAIVSELQGLRPREDHTQRGESWRTAGELLPLIQHHWRGTKRDLDAALVKRFLADDDCPIRPANYPSEGRCRRLWGHVANVKAGPGREALQDKLNRQPLLLEPETLGPEAPIFFLSHALEDHHFAARIRLSLAGQHKVRSWLAEGDLHDGDNLFEAVEAAIARCNALMLLISSQSISSAWVYSEAQAALGEGKTIVPVIDASDTAICDLLGAWLSRDGEGKEDAGAWLGGDGIRLASAVLQRYMRGGSPSRILKFTTGVSYALESLTFRGPVAFYPAPPQDYPNLYEVVGFNDVDWSTVARKGFEDGLATAAS